MSQEKQFDKREGYDQDALDAASREVHLMLLREGSSWGAKACEEMGRVFMTAYRKALPSHERENGEAPDYVPGFSHSGGAWQSNPLNEFAMWIKAYKPAKPYDHSDMAACWHASKRATASAPSTPVDTSSVVSAKSAEGVTQAAACAPSTTARTTVATVVTAALVMAKATLGRWAELYGKLSEAYPKVRQMDYNLPPGDHVRIRNRTEARPDR